MNEKIFNQFIERFGLDATLKSRSITLNEYGDEVESFTETSIKVFPKTFSSTKTSQEDVGEVNRDRIIFLVKKSLMVQVNDIIFFQGNNYRVKYTYEYDTHKSVICDAQSY